MIYMLAEIGHVKADFSQHSMLVKRLREKRRVEYVRQFIK